MSDYNITDLSGKVLIAAPYTMKDDIFYKSIIYIIQHTKEGSIGLIINHPIHHSSSSNVLKKIDTNIDFKDLGLDIHLGGPLEMERGFFLHTSEYNKNLLFNATDVKNSGLVVSSNLQIIEDISNGIGPKQTLFILGYTGWTANQLESELQNNLWIISELNLNLVFNKNLKSKWNKALLTLGISKQDFAPEIALS